MKLARPRRLPAISVILYMCGKVGAAQASELVLLGVYEQVAPVTVNSTANTTFTASTGFGAGLQLSASLYRRLELELGASYTRRAWNDTLSGDHLLPAIDIPVGLRFRIFRFFAIEAGGYYSSINAGSRVDYISTIDYGAYGGAQLMLPFFFRTSLLLGGRYLYGLANVSLVGGQLSFRGYEALAGLQFNLGKTN